jgi:hypothetical protein
LESIVMVFECKKKGITDYLHDILFGAEFIKVVQLFVFQTNWPSYF